MPQIEYHQHIAGPEAVKHVAQGEALAAINLPPGLARVLQERQRISGSDETDALYFEDAQILDVSEGEDHWTRGKAAVQRMVQAYTPNTRFVPTSYGVDAATAFISGVIREPDSSDDEMHFALGLKRDARGVWRIALEYATVKPPLEFPEPITADRTIQALDDAGIRRGVVLSLGYWFGDGTETDTASEHAHVRAENDWVVKEVNRYPNRLVAFCGVNPLRDYALAELDRCSRLPNVKGMKLHFGNSRIDVRNAQHLARLREFFKAANGKHMAIVVHLWTFDRTYGREHSQIFLDSILPMAPDVTVQIAHMAGAGRYVHDDAMAVFAEAAQRKDPRMKNVYVDLATVVTESQTDSTIALITKRIRQVGVDHVLFGADAPVLNRPRPLQAWATIRRRLPLSDDELRTIATNVARYMR
ncbi:MAG TPA: amidohydrolase family protein [Gemmatimonadaceae bacterium]|nr:amidohydrolase family protein [Gemmatimonadaceae bacterium]